MTGNANEERLTHAVLHLNGRILGLTFGLISGLTIFIATNWLVLKGGDVVGPHLSLLDQFFWGYSVSFKGSFIGMAYGFIVGYLAGWLIAWVYNFIVIFRGE